MARKRATGATLYCSFCGKSQHEVRKLIAGPSVFICDECIDICVDISVERDVRSRPDGKTSFNIILKFVDKLSGHEIDLLPKFAKAINSAFSDVEISLSSVFIRPDADAVVIDVIAITDNAEALKEEIEELSMKLRIAQQKYLVEQATRIETEARLDEMMRDLYPILVERIKSDINYQKEGTKELLTLFLDIVGFSSMSDPDRKVTLDALRSIGQMSLSGSGGMYINTWGDAILAGFASPTQGLICACRFIKHLDVMGIDARIGVTWGAVRVMRNSVTGRLDIDGDSVNMGARLEALADPQTVLCAPEVPHLDLKSDKFRFRKKIVQLKKGAGTYEAGDEVKAYEVSLIQNR